MKLKDKTQITIQVDDEVFEDIKVLARRRGQTMTKFITLAVERELEEEAIRQVS